MKNSKYILLAVVTLVILVVDQVSKNMILAQFQHGESVSVITDYFNITYVRNPGAAFGIFRDIQTNIRELFFLMMPPVAMIIIFFMLRATPKAERLRTLALCSIFGGALGNYIDRVRFSYVVDFLDFHVKNHYSWPAFNVADMAIVAGVSFLILLEVQLMKKEWTEKKSDKREASKVS